MADTADINSPDYWNRRFAVDWTERGGAEQTAFFARLAIEMLPDWFWRDANDKALSLLDVGCALGEALPGLKARLPESALAGADVSDVAIRMAKARLPQFAFHVVAADWSDAPQADIVFCSNTLEHLEDWRNRLVKLGELAKRYVVALVPFQERDLIDEHVASFDFASFPAELPDGKHLIFFRIIDAAAEPDTHWQGHQALALYGPRGKARKTAPADLDAYAGADLRGLTPQQITTAMTSLRASDSTPQAPWVAALVPRRSSDPTQAVVDRINDEWQQKFAASNADYMAKHAEMKAYYERVLAERDAKIVLFDQLMNARVELERVKTVAEYQAADLKREREQNDALRASLARLPSLEEDSAQLVTARKALGERDAALAALETRLKSTQADVAAAKSALRVAVDERDEARKAAAQALPSAEAEALRAELAYVYAEKERHENNAASLRDHYETFVAGLRADLEAAYADKAQLAALGAERTAHEQNGIALREHYEAHLRGINDRLAQFAEEMQAALETLRNSWQGDLSRANNASTLDQQHAREVRELLTQILASKSWALAMRVRRLYLDIRGNADPGMPVVPQQPENTGRNAVSEFLARWDFAKSVLYQIAGDLNPAGASDPAPRAPRAPAPVMQTPSAPPTSRERSDGRVLAMQVASLANGGLERVVLDLCIGLKKRNVPVLVIAVHTGGPIADELRQRDIPVFEVHQDRAEYERLLREQGVTDLFMHHSYFGVEQSAGAGVRLYDVVHNYYFWHRDKIDHIHNIAERCERLIYVSSAVREFHERVFGVQHAKGVVINNPAHLDGLIVPDKAQLLRLREKQDDAVFLNVAQAFPAKAQAAMITAFARAHRARGGMRLQIAGASVREEADRAVQQRIDEEGIAAAVELLGHCDRRTMSRLYAQAHAFVLPSIYEGYSVSAIEAAAYGLPLIMTDVGGAQDLINNGGCGIRLPPAIADLARPSVQEINQIGLAPENGATAALERAFADVAGNRPQWTQRGLEAHFNVRTLDEVIDAYLAAGVVTARL